MEQIEAASSMEDVEGLRSENKGMYISPLVIMIMSKIISETENIQRTHERLSELIEGKKWDEVADTVIHLKYLENIEAAAKQKEDELS